MNSKKNLVLLGMMGSGKSSIGYLVSKKLNLKFFDIDVLIEDEIGMKIANIFKEKGENYFRKIEQRITLKILKTNTSVVSLGGGGFINNKIRKEVLSNNLSFWLNWDSEVLLKRITSSKKRPLAFNSNDQEILRLIEERLIIYTKSKFKINCDKLTKTEVVKKIIKIYGLN